MTQRQVGPCELMARRNSAALFLLERGREANRRPTDELAPASAMSVFRRYPKEFAFSSQVSAAEMVAF